MCRQTVDAKRTAASETLRTVRLPTRSTLLRKRQRSFAYSVSVVFHSKVFQCFGRTSLPFGNGLVAEVLQILDAHFAGPEAARGQIAEAGEEHRTLAERRLHLRRVRQVIQHLLLLHVCTSDEALVESRFAQSIDEREAAAHRRLSSRLIDHHEVHEFRYARIAGAAGALVFGNNPVCQGSNRGEFVRCKKLWTESCSARRCVT